MLAQGSCDTRTYITMHMIDMNHVMRTSPIECHVQKPDMSMSHLEQPASPT